MIPGSRGDAGSAENNAVPRAHRASGVKHVRDPNCPEVYPVEKKQVQASKREPVPVPGNP